MSATHEESEARNWMRSTALISVSVTLAICSCLPLKADGRGYMCEREGEILAIYDCQTGLVLWSRRSTEPMPPMGPPDKELCRLVVGPLQPMQDAGQCL